MIYIVRRHNEFQKMRDVTIGAFSSPRKTLEAIRSDMLDNGYYDSAMAIDISDDLGFIHQPSGLSLTSIRYAYDDNPFAQFYEIKIMTLDGE